MKIAIMGAGLAGLSCALTLEKYGYQADIFERRGMVGDRFIIAEAMFAMFHTPFDDAVEYLSETHDIHLKPSSNIHKVYIHSENETSFLKGPLGFTNMRGKHPDSYEKQLADQLKGEIIYNRNVTYEEVSKQYTHVVLATGDAMDTEKLQSYEVALKATFKGAVVEGNFKRTETHTFFNHHIAPKGMAYLLPHSDGEASLVMVYPQYPENEKMDKEQLWKKCIEECIKKTGLKLTFKHEWSIKDYRIGKTESARIGNTFFTGNCFGAITPLIGFGQFESILTGIYAAHDLAGVGKYEKLVKPLTKGYYDSLTLRRALEKLDNQQLDLLTKSINNKTVGKLLTSKNVNILKILSRMIHPLSRQT